MWGHHRIHTEVHIRATGYELPNTDLIKGNPPHPHLPQNQHEYIDYKLSSSAHVCGKTGVGILSQFYLEDLERSWGTLIYQSPQVFWPLIQLLQQSAHLSHLTSCCDQLPLDGCLSHKTKSKSLKGGHCSCSHVCY